ncbi:UBX domain-containing protein 6 [Lucilia cuprina]|nr:UBX domain-containing protein 6 [Lucilia cuprina]
MSRDLLTSTRTDSRPIAEKQTLPVMGGAEDCILTLTKYLENIVKFPEEEKYYKIRMSNRIFCEKVRYVEGALDFLQAAGFREVDLDDEKFLIWSKDNVEQDYELPTLIEALQNSEPIQLVLDRNIKVLLPSQAKRVVLPDDFYRISPEEIKREQQLRAEAIESAQILKTKAMREREEQRALRMYKYALVRVKFPNGLFIQGTFSVYEKICDIFEFVQSCLQDESMEFNLVASSEGKFTEEDMDKTLYDLRFNRADIVINDLPAGMEDLVAVGVKIGSIHDVQISENDINHVCYFNNRKAILIKFNRVSLRDKIMKQYLSSRSLTVRDVIGGDIASRVYLNDHYSPAAKLNAICRKLLNRKIISKYKTLNNDRVKANITMSGGDEVVLDCAGCSELLV